jgi:hypothetical protein
MIFGTFIAVLDAAIKNRLFAFLINANPFYRIATFALLNLPLQFTLLTN